MVAVAAMVASRAAVRARARRQPWYLQNTLIVGSGPLIAPMVAKILRHPEYGINLVGCVDLSDDDKVAFMGGAVPAIRGDVNLLQVIEQRDVERV